MNNLFLDNYWIKEKLGKGKISVVYKAVRTDDGAEVVLKQIKLSSLLLKSQKSERYTRFMTEIEKISSLDHPNIAKTYKFFEEEGFFYLELEAISGKNLSQILIEKNPLTFKQGANIFLQAAKALSSAHSKGVIHKNLSPRSIFYLKDNIVKISDFSSYLFNFDESLKEIATSFIPPKYIDYLAPEQLKKGTVDDRADVYSLGAVMFELFAGRPPFSNEDRDALQEKILTGKLIQPKLLNKNIPEFLNKILIKSLQKDPQNRYKNMNELIEEIKSYLEGGKITDDEIKPDKAAKFKNSIAVSIGTFWLKLKNKFKKIKKGKDKKSVVGHPKSSKKVLLGTKPSRYKKKKKLLKKPRRSSWNPVIILLVLIILSYFGLKYYKKINIFNPISTPTPVSSPIKYPKASAGVEDNKPRGSLTITIDASDVFVTLKNNYDHSIPPFQKRAGAAGEKIHLKLIPGTYSIKAAKKTYGNFESQFEIMQGDSIAINIKLDKKIPRIQIFTKPMDAKVYLDKILCGKTPLTLYDIKYGKYKLIIKKNGFKNETREVSLEPEIPCIIHHNLIPTDKAAIKKKDVLISVFSKPAGAKILINNVVIGKTPLLKKKFRTGNFKMELRLDSYIPKFMDITLKSGKVNELYAKMEPEPMKVTPTTTQYTKAPPKKTPSLKIAKKKKDKKNYIVKVLPLVRIKNGTAYDKFKRQPIYLSFDRLELVDAVEIICKRSKKIELTDSRLDSDLVLIFRFAVEINAFTKSSNPKINLCSYVQLTDVRERIKFYSEKEIIKMPFPSDVSLRSVKKGRGQFTRYNLTDARNPTKCAKLFIKKVLPRVLREISKYDPGKHSTKQ